MSARTAGRWAAACIAVGAALVLITAARTSVTQDEPSFFSYGWRVATQGDFARPLATDNSKLPAAALNVLVAEMLARPGCTTPKLTAALTRLYAPQEAAYIAEHFGIYAGRLATVVFYVGLCVLVFFWGREAYGPRGALAATALLAFLPTLLGHAAVMTADVAATCLMFAAVYALARCFQDASLQGALLAGLALGAAQVVKYTAVGLVPIALLMIVARVVTAERTESRWRVLHASLFALLVALVVALLVINLGFLFHGTGVRLAALPCRSGVCHAMQAIVGNLPLPLPREYLHGFDLVNLHDETGVGGGSVYLLGALSRTGFASYFVWAALLKTPLPFLLLLLARPWRRHRRYTDLVWAAPVLWLFVHLSFFFHTQLGLRFFLPAFPFLALLAAASFDDRRAPRWRTIAAALVAAQCIATLVQCPRYLAYFNPLIGSRLQAYRYLADSNLDWGQDRFALWAWQRAHAGAAYALEPDGPVQGRVIVRVNDLVGIDDPEKYRWLREHAAPVAVIGDSYLVFEVRGHGM